MLRELGNGLVMRQAVTQDIDALAAFNAMVHKDEGVAAIVRDLTSEKHPTMNVGDFTLVEDTRTGEIVSSLCLIPQTWTYAGIPFKAGQIELVGTHPNYRNRGLMRAQMQAAHQWSAERGELAQVICGIPFYYRQFGYDMCLNLQGWHCTSIGDVPTFADAQTESYRVHLATNDDLGLIANLYEAGCKRSLVACIRDMARWRYELNDASEQNLERRTLCMIEDAEGRAVGFLAHRPYMDFKMMLGIAYELVEGVSWRAVTPSVMRYLASMGLQMAERQKDVCKLVGFELGETHPAYDAMPQSLPIHRKPYAWYVRVPDVVGFLRHIKPELERRLAVSTVTGYSGELKIGFYTDGVRVIFDQGKITEIECWKPSPDSWGNVAFPGLTFLQVLFGYRSLSEVRYAFADCFTTNEEAQVLVDSLFVKQASNVWAVT